MSGEARKNRGNARDSSGTLRREKVLNIRNEIFGGYPGKAEGENSMKKENAILQQSDRYIMEKLWEESPRTITQLYHELKEEQGWSKSTVNTLLTRMVEKEIIYYEEGGRARQYYPAIKREDAAVAETENLLQRVYKGSVGMMMNTMIKESAFSQEEIEELYEILRKGK